MAIRGLLLLAAWLGLAGPGRAWIRDSSSLAHAPAPAHGLGAEPIDRPEPRGMSPPAIGVKGAPSFVCPLALRTEPLPSELLRPEPFRPPSGVSQPDSNPDANTLPSSQPATGVPSSSSPSPIAEPAQAPTAGSSPAASAEPAAPLPPDYRLRLRPTTLGWPILKRWCVWVEPPAPDGQPEDRWQQRWREAVDQALVQWAGLLPLQRVDRPEAAQILLFRRRPPRQTGADGRLRASHGRALLSLRQVDRGQGLRLEPLVHVVLSPDQRAEALQATALHELGHGLGLWGHSDSNHDVMAARPGPQPILRLSERDRATLAWLYSQSTRFGQPLTPGKAAPLLMDGPSQTSGEEIKR
jgi:hypothetical protein